MLQTKNTRTKQMLIYPRPRNQVETCNVRYRIESILGLNRAVLTYVFAVVNDDVARNPNIVIDLHVVEERYEDKIEISLPNLEESMSKTLFFDLINKKGQRTTPHMPLFCLPPKTKPCVRNKRKTKKQA